MEYGRSDSSGTDDDLPPSQPGRSFKAGRMSGNGRAISGGGNYGRSASDQHVQKLEKDAYLAVLRAFTAQSAVITWRKEQLMVTLRQELRISDEQHLEFLMGMDSGTAPHQQFRERHMQEEEELGAMYRSNMDPVPPNAFASRKKQKTTHVSQTSMPPPALKSLQAPAVSPIISGKKAPPPGGSRGKKGKGGRQQVGGPIPSTKSAMPSSVAGTISHINPWIGKRVKTRWPADNTFYEAVITDYDAEKDLHALVYEMNTANETWEWVDLKELSSNDLKIVEGPPVNVVGKGPPSAPSNFGMGGRGAIGRGPKKGTGRIAVPSAGVQGRATSKGPFDRTGSAVPVKSWKTTGSENGPKGLRHIQLPSLNALVKQVDRIAEEDDLMKIESIKRVAKEHEEMLRKALAEIGESSDDGESDEQGNPHFSHTQSIDRERERRSRQDSRGQHDDDDDTAGDRDEGSDGDHMADAASDADDEHHDDDDDG